MLYPHHIDWVDRVPVATKEPGIVVSLPPAEPLKLECMHFLECIAKGEKPRTDGVSGLRVLKLLEACEESLHRKGSPVELNPVQPSYYAHPTAVVDQPCEIGEGTKIWHFSHIMSGCKLGARCNLGQNVVVSPGVQIGSNVKIQNNVSVYTGCELEDDVFCGPSMVFTNVINPRSHVVRRNEYKRTLVKRGASLGTNSTVVCGITIGRYAFLAAGAVANRDVPDYALMASVPARRIGWVCNCGCVCTEPAKSLARLVAEPTGSRTIPVSNPAIVPKGQLRRSERSVDHQRHLASLDLFGSKCIWRMGLIKVLCVVGARPQFVKAGVVFSRLARYRSHHRGVRPYRPAL